MAHALLTSLGLVAAWHLFGCAGSPPPSAPAVAARPPPPPVALPDAGWGEVDSARFFLSFPLPDARTWHVDDASGRWLEARHLASKSRLFARAWREGSVIRRAACEAQARSWRPELFGRDEAALSGRRAARAPEGFEAEVAFLVNRKGEAWGGVVVVTAANVRKCVALAFATRAEGARAEEELAERLALIERGVFARLRTRSIDDRARDMTRGRAPTPTDQPPSTR